MTSKVVLRYEVKELGFRTQERVSPLTVFKSDASCANPPRVKNL